MKVYTRDIYLAACYLVFGARLLSVDKTDTRHQEFEFDTCGHDLDAVRNQYTNGLLYVNVIDFKNALMRVRSEIHSY